MEIQSISAMAPNQKFTTKKVIAKACEDALPILNPPILSLPRKGTGVHADIVITDLKGIPAYS